VGEDSRKWARRRWCAAFASVALAATTASAATFPPGFQEATLFSGLSQPTVVKFASDGRVFVAEKSGLIKVFASLTATTPTTFADLRSEVYNYWDRGLLGLALHPNFPATPYVYVLYTLDKNPADALSPVPTWNDNCPTPPGATTDGCPASGRLARLTASGNAMVPGSELVLLGLRNDGSGQTWCQQFPSHSIGTVAFGADGALYVSSGEGASFDNVDYGQLGGTLPSAAAPLIPRNVCGDPPAGVGVAMPPGTAQGGALRSQSLRRPTGPVVLNGTILRVNPDTGAAMPDNALAANPDDNAKRIVAYGLRNPFRITTRPGTREIWIGDVGYNAWEEVNRLVDPLAAPPNFGWPCYEGTGKQGGYDGTNIESCETLYAAGTAVAPHHAYSHVGSSSIAGLAFYDTGSYPASHQGALFFTDYNRRILFEMPKDGTGVPNPSQLTTFASGLSGGAVDLVRGPAGDIVYVDYDGGRIQRITYGGPNAIATATPTSGTLPLLVQFDGSASTGTSLTYAWDLDGDGQFDDSTAVNPSWTYSTAGNYVIRLRVLDSASMASTSAPITIGAGNTAPLATIATPSPTLTFKVGDSIAFSGSGSDPQDGALAASRLSWRLILQHCPSNCHEHVVQDFAGVASGSFSAPDHEYPSYLELRLTATDSSGLTGVASVNLDPRTVTLGFETNPAGLQLSTNLSSKAAPFAQTVIVGSSNSLSAPVTQTLAGRVYTFRSWSDNGAAAHQIVAPVNPATYRAEYRTSLRFFTLKPCRLVDTRTSGPALGSGADRVLTVTGACGVPATARAVSVNVTVTQPTAAGYLVLRANGTTVPVASTINYGTGQTRANAATVALSTSGQVAVRNGQATGTAHFILDVNGYLE
jgi:glucose/arabinose dehydrogenase